ncbi:MAG: glycosyltransferase [Gammaproteobacteria bacterium]|nr:MAG: glycosyltransferase [Gammaproteobacteria bacterium]
MVADAHSLKHSLQLAVVVPTLDDDAALARLLPRLAQLPSPPDRVIVVDGASSEATAAICRKSRRALRHLRLMSCGSCMPTASRIRVPPRRFARQSAMARSAGTSASASTVSAVG